MAVLHPSIAAAKGAHKAGSLAHAKSAAVRRLSVQVDELVQCQDTNLVAKEQRLKHLETQFLEFHEDDVFELQRALIPVYAELSDKAVEHKMQQKWLQLGFLESILSTHADCVYFLMRSGLAFSIATFKEATVKGSSLHDVLIEAGEPMIRMQGEYVPWFKLKQKLEINIHTGKVSSITNPEQVYTYSSPQGIIQADQTPCPLYPIEILSPEELKSLQVHAKAFLDDPLKECILQVVTTGDFAMSPSWLVEGINDVQPKHTSVRLVDGKGRVYSFGLEIPKVFEEYVKENPRSCMAAGYAKVGTPDYRDTRSFDERLVTTIPIDATTLDTILAFANSINEGQGARFSITKQNCTTFGVVALGLAGITVDSRASLFDLLGRLVPKGGPLSWLKSKVSSVVAPLFSWFNTYTPPIVKKVCFAASYALSYIPKKLVTIFVNSIYLLFGADKEAQQLSENSGALRVTSFRSVISSWTDLFDDDTSLIVHPYKLVEWQKEQKSSIHYGPSSVPAMHLLPKY